MLLGSFLRVRLNRRSIGLAFALLLLAVLPIAGPGLAGVASGNFFNGSFPTRAAISSR